MRHRLTVQRSGLIILHPTTVKIKPGARIGLVGVSGSGKSTLGQLLIDSPTAQGHRVTQSPKEQQTKPHFLRPLA